jgi:hypothetical protein
VTSYRLTLESKADVLAELTAGSHGHGRHVAAFDCACGRLHIVVIGSMATPYDIRPLPPDVTCNHDDRGLGGELPAHVSCPACGARTERLRG